MASLYFDTREQKELFFNMLKVLGGHRVIVNFQGGGDSGEVETGTLYDAHENEISMDGITFDWAKTSDEFDHETGKWVTKTKEMPMELGEVLRDVTESLLEHEGFDWYNNEGGQGTLTIDLTKTPPTVMLNVGINRMETDEHEFDYTDADEEDEETVTSEEGK